MATEQSYLDDLERRLPTVEVDLEGVVLEVGSATRELLGLQHAGLIGRRFDEIFPEDDSGHAGSRMLTTDLWDQTRPSRFRLVVLDHPSKDRKLHLLFEQDDLYRARKECIGLTRLASAGRLISSIVHEINNPLSGIIGYSQLLLMRELEADVRGSLEKVYGEALRASRIVRNLLDFSRRRATTRGGVRLGRVLRKALELKAHDLRVRNVSVHLDVPDSLPMVYGDQHQLLQVFVNLISNSEQAMYGSDQGGRISFHSSVNKDTISLILEDTGPGVPEELRSRVFEPFFTTKGEGMGTGLGLSLCREILSKQQASIRLLGNQESGAAFQLLFQMFHADSKDLVTEQRPRQVPRVRGKRLVVVEDDPVCRSMIAEAFERNGNTVHVFDRSEVALRFLRSRVVDLVISDLHRPGLNGLEFHKRVAMFDPSLASRILFLTGDTLNPELLVLLKKTGNLHLAKPVLLHDLFGAVQKLLARPGTQQKTLFTVDERSTDPQS
ncbi:MAG: ATP-binding protein [Planctomycetota bacterium]